MKKAPPESSEAALAFICKPQSAEGKRRKQEKTMKNDESMEIRIINAREADTKRIAFFYEALIQKMSDHPFRPKWIKGVYPSYYDIREICLNEAFFLAIQKDTILGAVAVVKGGDQNHKHVPWKIKAMPEEISTLHLLAVAPEMQRQGIGYLLVKSAENLCRQQGCKVIRLDTLPESVPGNRLYQKCGFTLVATDTRFYESVGSIDFNYYELQL